MAFAAWSDSPGDPGFFIAVASRIWLAGGSSRVRILSDQRRQGMTNKAQARSAESGKQDSAAVLNANDVYRELLEETNPIAASSETSLKPRWQNG
jgi:hypothetical protein